MPVVGPPLASITLPNHLLDAGLRADPNDVALESMVQAWTWRQLDETVNRLAQALLELGLAPGDRVASLMPNRIVLLVHYMACLRAGLVVVPLNYRYLAFHIDHALDVSGASLLVAHGERAKDLLACKRIDQLALPVVWFESSPDPIAPRLEDLCEGPTVQRALPEPAPTDPCSIFFTSGSTGQPKGVTHTHASLAAMMAAVVQSMELVPEDIVLPGSSISHLGGFLFSFTALSIGARAAVARSLASVDMIPLLRKTRPTVMTMLPTALLQLIGERSLIPQDLASLRLVRGSADKIPAELERRFTEITGFPINEGYGMTEVGMATLSPLSGEVRCGSVGRPLPGFSMSVRDAQGNELGAGCEGVLWMRSPTMTSGYWARPDASAAAIHDGWLNSGDLVLVDADGFLWFRGRKKQIIVHDGSNICPQEVEEALLEHPGVANAGVVGVHDTLHGENVWAFITLDGSLSGPIDEAHLIRFARRRIGYKAPEHIFFIDEMPLNPTGKIDRMVLKRWALEHHDA
ncbi:MAG: class I adenylate-forming enzyme family protein [Pseudomonadota bacterium]